MREKKTTTQKTQTKEQTVKSRGAEQERQTHITNVYKNISTEERIRMYLKICRYIEYGEKLQ